ncbi:hypothetical protein LIER_08477 [Lithospermum erythrorhizon]|uniref:CCHC-type domain-containing protein n=1 Tax=Lithospermum erythrorhizon TaxID=34254 RepID=A0AAV3PCX1_LITER
MLWEKSYFWTVKGSLNVIDLGEDFFIVRFTVEEDYLMALHEGPWFINGFFLSIRLWEPNFNPSQATTKSPVVWLRLPRVPMEYYNAEVLKEIGMQLGTLLRIDTKTANSERGRFILYENVTLCFTCGLLGHDSENCFADKQPIYTNLAPQIIEKKSDDPTLPISNIDTEPPSPTKNCDFGEWLLVSRKKTIKKNTKSVVKPSHRSGKKNPLGFQSQK